MPRAGILRTLSLLLLGLATGTRGAELSLARLGTRDGLPHSNVTVLRQDRRGFLWVGTSEGVARFDGQQFERYGRAEGLVATGIYEVLEDSRGRIWVGTNSGGVAWLEEGPPARFHVRRLGAERDANVVPVLREGSDGQLWAVTLDGLYRLDPDGDEEARCIRPRTSIGWSMVAVDDAGGAPWILGEDEIVAASGEEPAAVASPIPKGLGPPWSAGRIAAGRWFVTGAGWAGEVAIPRGGARATFLPRPWPLADTGASDVAVDAEGTVWAATTLGLVRCAEGLAELLGTANGLPDERLGAVLSDLEGNLWIGTRFRGLLRKPRTPLVSYTVASGLGEAAVISVQQTADGTILAATERSGVFAVGRDRAELVPGSSDARFRRVQRAFTQDRRGDFWVSGADGVWIIPGEPLSFSGGAALADLSGWPPGTPAYGDVHEAADGSIWLSEFPSDRPWRCMPEGEAPGSRAVTCTLQGAGLAPPAGGRAIASDAEGRVWLASHRGLWRYRDGELRPVEPADGWPDPERNVMAVHVDRRGRLWIGMRNAGAAVTAELDAPRPHFRHFTAAGGLSSDSVWAISEDDDGRIYLGTGRGLDVLSFDVRGDVASVSHVHQEDGLPDDLVLALCATGEGRIAIGTTGGLAILDPRARMPALPPPPVFIGKVLAGGELVSTGGAPVELGPGRIGLHIEYLAIALSGVPVRYQHRLGSADPWSPPEESRYVEYPRLPPGEYAFQVRAVNEDGLASPRHAGLSFTVLVPLWRRPWFLGLAAALVAAAALAWHRERLERAVAVERLRRQIATDLHDDVGSGLSQIAVLSEVAKRRAEGVAPGELDDVADLARALRESMSDIVWAIDVRHDHLADLVQRMRRAATQMLEAQGIELSFRVDAGLVERRTGVGPLQRRHLLLLFKEAIHNAAKHAAAGRVEVELAATGPRLRLVVRDDGRGFDPATAAPGTGIASMQQRAAALGAKLTLVSRPGEGTTLSLEWEP